MFISFRTTDTENLSILSPLEINFLLNFHIKDTYLTLIQKTRNQILDTNVSPGPPSAPGELLGLRGVLG